MSLKNLKNPSLFERKNVWSENLQKNSFESSGFNSPALKKQPSVYKRTSSCKEIKLNNITKPEGVRFSLN